MSALGLVDSGATVNVLPYDLGLLLGADWDAQSTAIKLTGNLATHEARVITLHARVADFSQTQLIFAWSRNPQIPLILGQTNFFDEFDICLHRTRRIFELEPSRR